MNIEHHYKESYRRLLKVATRNVVDYNVQIAEECVQQAYTNLLSYIKAGHDIIPGSEEALMYKILFNCIYDSNTCELLRGMTGKGKRVEFNEDHVDTLSEIEGDNLELHEQMCLKLVIGGFNNESPQTRDILHLFFVFGYTHAEIAGEVGCTQKASRAVVYTCLRKLRNEK